MTHSSIHRIALTLVLSLSIPGLGQETAAHLVAGEVSGQKTEERAEAEKSCTARSVEAVTDRPTVATSTETTQCGVMEFLAGPERFWTGHGLHQDDLAEAVQFGVTHALDFHYAGTGFFTTGSAHSGTLSGVSDTNLGLRYRLNEQRHRLPSFGLFYNVKVPTASVTDGLSSGRFDHQIGFLAGKDIPHVHFDFNAIPQLTGRQGVSGFDRNTALVLFGSVPMARKRLSLVAGSFGFTRLNSNTPAYASATVGFAWRVHPRLILDAGWDEGLTSFAPRKRIGFGFTYAPVNVYSLFVHTPEAALKNPSSHD